MVIPQPIDALVLQVLVENIAEKILTNQPSENAYYSRDRHAVKHPHEVEEYGLSWREQWKQLQKQIYHFSETKKLIVVTDLSNYYDSIDIKELRKVFSSYTKIDEVLIDILFKIIEDISWRPDYLPYSGRGLPTTNIEGIRLLAHSFLFEIDTVIKQKTNNCFTRWMDDIVIGVDTPKEAIETISAVSDMLKSRGLALNVAKTSIYTQDEAYYHFQIEANRYIDKIENAKKKDANYKKICFELHKRFKSHLADKRNAPKYWDKIAKRYITTYGKLKSKSLIKILSSIYVENPGLRTNLLHYLTIVGYTLKTEEAIFKILNSIYIFDDISLYQLCYLVTNWEIPVNIQSKSFLKKFEKKITDLSFSRKVPTDFYCILWFKAKYSHPEELLAFIQKYKNLWRTNSFLRRQATAILSRLLLRDSKAVAKLLSNQISSGIPNTVTLANQIARFSRIDKIDFKLNAYLFPENIQRPYPLGKYLVLCSVLNSPKIKKNDILKNKIKEHIKDPYYLKWLDLLFNIN